MERLLTATVERDGTGPVLLCGNTLDELSLSHDGNQLRRVPDQCAGLAYEGAMDFKDGADAATEYSYDACGNMTSDRNKGITGISYNVLNLPEEVRFADGHVTRYAWCASNPIKHIDLTGKESINGINMNEKNAKNVIPGLLNKYQNTNKIVVISHGNETGTALVYSVKKWRVEFLYILKITFLQPRVLKNTSSPLQKYGSQPKKQNTKVWLSCLIHVMWEDQMVLPRKCQRHFLE